MGKEWYTMPETSVDYNFLGKTGVRVSNLCLGTMTFGKSANVLQGMSLPTQADEELSFQIMDKFKELGGNFLDTANIYSVGMSEKIVGKWLSKQCRRDFIIATKVRFNMDPSKENKLGLSRRHMIESVEESLQRLQTNYIDLYQSHLWDNATPIEETLRTFDDLIRCGKIRYFGCSNVCGWQLQKIVDRIQTMGLSNVVTLQQQYNLLVRQSEFEEFMVCHNEGIGVLPWSPLKGGLLTGKFARDSSPEKTGSRVGFVHSDETKALQSAPAWSKYNGDEGYWTLIDSMKEIGDKYGKSIPQVALRWLIQKPVVTSVIIGATSVKQLEDNMGASKGWALSDDDMSLLDEVSPRLNVYPYEMIWRANNGRFNPFNNSNCV